jgi:hypothetical protein
MDTRLVLELVGYAASALVAVSLMMRSILRLRVINLVGSATFTVYGVLIQAYPVAATNALIVGINLYYLRQMLGSREFFDLLRVRPDADYVRRFLDFHREEIARFLPGFVHAPSEEQLSFFVLRDMLPAGLFLGERRGEGVLRVALDFVIPQFRDFRTGTYVFRDRAEFFREHGVRVIESEAGSRVHADYLRRMGFAEEGGVFRLRVG